MSLQDKLDAFKADFERKLPPEILSQMHQATKDLANSGILDGVIKTGSALPAFALKDQNGAVVRSEDLLADGPLIISFFRGAWCPYCMVELKALDDITADVADAGGKLIVISPQTPEKSKEMVDKEGLSLTILSDAGTDYAKQLGTSFVLPENLRAIYGQLGGFTLPEFNGDDSWRLPMPTRLVVAADGTVVHADINADYTVRPDPQDTLDVLKAHLAQKAA